MCSNCMLRSGWLSPIWSIFLFCCRLYPRVCSWVAMDLKEILMLCLVCRVCCMLRRDLLVQIRGFWGLP